MLNFTLYASNFKGNSSNCLYPHKKVVTDKETFLQAIKNDHVAAKYKNNYRSIGNFIEADNVPLDCDNDHSDNPNDWVTPSDLASEMVGVSFVISYSRNNMKQKGGRTPRPRFHVFFTTPTITDANEYAELKKKIINRFPYFDANALDSARFLYGTENMGVEIYEGDKSIIDYLNEDNFAEFDNQTYQVLEGQRNSTMSRIAGKLIKRYGATEQSYIIFLEKAQLCNPPLDDNELKHIWQSAVKFGNKVQAQDGYVAPEEFNKKSVWEMPIHFDEYNLPSFPIDALPKAISKYVLGVSESTQTPIDMAATAAIAVLSVCMQGKYKIQAKDDWLEPVNTFVLNVMNPSERKSAVESAMIRPLNMFEAERNTQNSAAIESSKMQKRILERRQRVLEDQASKGKATSDDVRKIAEEISEYKEMKPLKLYVDDITTEKLTSVLADNNGRAAILSTEGGIFDTLAGTYSKTVNIDVMLKGYSGDSIRVDRVGRNSESIMNPALTVLLMVQPSVLSGLMQNGIFRGRGLTARFLYCIPTSFVGKRKYRSECVSNEIYLEYENCIRNMLEDEYGNDIEIITLSQEADKMIEVFAEKLEPELNKSYADIVDWAGKVVGNILRISALLCRASIFRSHDFLDVSEPLVVDRETMSNAIKIGEYFIEHARAAFMLMGGDPVFNQSKKVIEAIKKNGLFEFTCRDIMRLCRNFKKAEDVQQVLIRLIDYGYIASKEVENYSGKGRPSAQIYLVNPHIYEQ